MPNLNFENLNHRPRHAKFISNVLSHRNNQIQVSSVTLHLGKTVDDNESVTRILNCAFSHNVQQLAVTRSPENTRGSPYSFIVTPMWDLPALTKLHLYHVKLVSDDDDDSSFFSKFTNLKTLSLRRCGTKETKVLNICHPRLSNLTLEYTSADMEFEEVVNVVTPQLKNLTMRCCQGKHLISAPGLTSLVIKGFHPFQLSTLEGFDSLEKVHLRIYQIYKARDYQVVSLFQQLRSVKLLKLNLEILKVILFIMCIDLTKEDTSKVLAR
ncbi:hypothetical protein L1887_31802 [Cichorium endivia]|nr:hypothetical protein L1887_31802 [Cichorium endivia]